MKITDLKMYFIPYRFLFLKIETDEGISGWGEPLVEGRADTLYAAVNEWKSFLVGQNPLEVERIWQTMYRCAFYRGGAVMMSTIAGINQALWDIKGKYYGLPIYEMMGGKVRDKVQCYRHVAGTTPEEYADAAELAVEQGYKVVKACPCPTASFVDSMQKLDQVEEVVCAIKDRIGNKADLALDFHGRFHRTMSKLMLRKLDKYDLLFIEEPVIPTNHDAMIELSKCSSIPIAQGERMFSRWDFKPMLDEGVVEIVQPDVSHAGGISECVRIGNMAETYDVAIAPHCPLSIISFAASIQVDAICENAVFQEQVIDIHDLSNNNPHMRFIKNASDFNFKDSYVTLPEKPGLGIEIDEDAVIEAAKIKHEFRNPRHRTEDGAPIDF